MRHGEAPASTEAQPGLPACILGMIQPQRDEGEPRAAPKTGGGTARGRAHLLQEKPWMAASHRPGRREGITGSGGLGSRREPAHPKSSRAVCQQCRFAQVRSIDVITWKKTSM